MTLSQFLSQIGVLGFGGHRSDSKRANHYSTQSASRFSSLLRQPLALTPGTTVPQSHYKKERLKLSCKHKCLLKFRLMALKRRHSKSEYRQGRCLQMEQRGLICLNKWSFLGQPSQSLEGGLGFTWPGEGLTFFFCHLPYFWSHHLFKQPITQRKSCVCYSVYSQPGVATSPSSHMSIGVTIHSELQVRSLGTCLLI